MTGETPTEQARRVANHLLTLVPPDTAARLVAQARAAGITWLGPQLMVYDDTDVLPPGEAAALVHTTPATLRNWVAAGILTRTPSGRYQVRDVYAAHAEIRRRRAHRTRTEHPAGEPAHTGPPTLS